MSSVRNGSQDPVFVDLQGQQYHVLKKLRSSVFSLPMAIRRDALGYVHLCPNGPEEIRLAREIIHIGELDRFDRNDGVVYTFNVVNRIRALSGGNFDAARRVLEEMRSWIKSAAAHNDRKWFEHGLMELSFRNADLAFEFRLRWGV